MTKVNVNKLLHSSYGVSVTKFDLQFTHSMALQAIQSVCMSATQELLVLLAVLVLLEHLDQLALLDLLELLVCQALPVQLVLLVQLGLLDSPVNRVALVQPDCQEIQVTFSCFFTDNGCLNLLAEVYSI